MVPGRGVVGHYIDRCIMDVYWDAVFYFGGGVLILATVLWLSATVYLYLVHRRYDHIPRPPMPRYVLI